VTRLHRIQNSVWAGEMTRTDWQDLDRSLKAHAGSARIQAWIFPSHPEVHHYGSQNDRESIFV
jgi:CRISPR/Cas system-associated endoribonuclease Cas2